MSAKRVRTASLKAREIAAASMPDPVSAKAKGSKGGGGGSGSAKRRASGSKEETKRSRTKGTKKSAAVRGDAQNDGLGAMVEDDTLYCVCLGRDDQTPMIMCEGCENWFHFRCINLSQEDATMISAYFCEMCEEAGTGKTRKNDEDGVIVDVAEPPPVQDLPPSPSSSHDDDDSVQDPDVHMSSGDDEDYESQGSAGDGSPRKKGKRSKATPNKSKRGTTPSSKNVPGGSGKSSSRKRKRKRAEGLSDDEDDEEEDETYRGGDPEEHKKKKRKSPSKKPPSTKSPSAKPASAKKSPSVPSRNASEIVPPASPAMPGSAGRKESLSTPDARAVDGVAIAQKTGTEVDSTRNKAIPMFTDILKSIFAAGKEGILDPDVEGRSSNFAREMEIELFNCFGEADPKGVKGARTNYVSKVRSLKYNMDKNVEFRSRIASGELDAAAVVHITPEELLTADQRAQRERVKAESLKNSVKQQVEIPKTKRTHKGEEVIESSFTSMPPEPEPIAPPPRLEPSRRSSGSPFVDDHLAKLPDSPATPFGSLDALRRSVGGTAEDEKGPPSPSVPNDPPTQDNDSEAKPFPAQEDKATLSASKTKFDLDSIWKTAKVPESPEVSDMPAPAGSEHPFDPTADNNPTGELEEKPKDEETKDEAEEFDPFGGITGHDYGDDLDAILEEDRKLLDKGKKSENHLPSSTTPPTEPPKPLEPKSNLPKLEDLPSMWAANVFVHEEGGYPFVGVQVGGRYLGTSPEIWRQVLPSSPGDFMVDGRLSVEESSKYLVQCRFSPTRELIALALLPDTSGPSSENPNKPQPDRVIPKLDHLVEHFTRRNRHGVVSSAANPNKKAIKDLYIVPLRPSDPLPEFIELLDEHQIPEAGERDSNIILAILVLQKGVFPTAPRQAMIPKQDGIPANQPPATSQGPPQVISSTPLIPPPTSAIAPSSSLVPPTPSVTTTSPSLAPPSTSALHSTSPSPLPFDPNLLASVSSSLLAGASNLQPQQQQPLQPAPVPTHVSQQAAQKFPLGDAEALRSYLRNMGPEPLEGFLRNPQLVQAVLTSGVDAARGLVKNDHLMAVVNRLDNADIQTLASYPPILAALEGAVHASMGSPNKDLGPQEEDLKSLQERADRGDKAAQDLLHTSPYASRHRRGRKQSQFGGTGRGTSGGRGGRWSGPHTGGRGQSPGGPPGDRGRFGPQASQPGFMPNAGAPNGNNLGRSRFT